MQRLQRPCGAKRQQEGDQVAVDALLGGVVAIATVRQQDGRAASVEERALCAWKFLLASCRFVSWF